MRSQLSIEARADVGDERYVAAAPANTRGTAAREQLIAHATRIFAAKGYAAAATREICDAAGVNVAAIHYYFGDKAGLYRAVLLRPISAVIDRFGAFDDPALSFEQSMRKFIAAFLSSRSDQTAAHVTRLHLREMLEPTEVFREMVEQLIVPHHNALAAVIARHCGLRRPDAGAHQLAFAIAAIAQDYCMSAEFMQMLAPGVFSRADQSDALLERLVGYSRALLDHEIARRGSERTKPAARKTSKRTAAGR